MSAWLELVAPGEAAVHGLTDGRLALFGYDRFLLGRARDCDVSIASSQLGRRHTAISWRSGLWQVEDLGGNNPARLNGGLLGRAARWRRLPRLQVSFTTPPPRPAWLELAAGDPTAAHGFVDGRYPLQLPRVDLGAARSSALVVESKLHPPRLTCLERMAGAWVLRHEFHAHPVRIDGAAVTGDVWLTDGLVFELPSGHRLRFRCP